MSMTHQSTRVCSLAKAKNPTWVMKMGSRNLGVEGGSRLVLRRGRVGNNIVYFSFMNHSLLHKKLTWQS